MDKTLKMLVGAACICVIGFTAHYAYGVYSDRQETIRREAQAAADAKARLDAAVKEAEAKNAEALAALEAECVKRVPSQSTDNLKALYKQCVADNAGLFGVKPPAQ